MPEQGEKVDVESSKTRRAKILIGDVNYAENCKNITAFQREARGVARDFLALQAELEAARERASLLRSAYAHLKDGQKAKAQRLYDATFASPEPPQEQQ